MRGTSAIRTMAFVEMRKEVRVIPRNYEPSARFR